jgi:hypothetical protein
VVDYDPVESMASLTESSWPLYLGAGTGDIGDTLPDGPLAGPGT